MERVLKMIKLAAVKNVVYYIGNYLLRVAYLAVSMFPIKRNKICFSNMNGKGYADNPKYVAEQIIHENRDIEMVWVLSDGTEPMADGIRGIKLYSLGGFLAFATSKIWVSNARLPLFLNKKKNQIYFQLWHGGCGPKKIERAAESKLIRWYISCAKHDSKMVDYFVSNSRFNSDMIRKFFWYDGEILNYGSPRHDIFFKEASASYKKVIDRLKIEDGCKLILYAPTFRNDKDLAVYRWEYKKALITAEAKYHGRYKFILRLHPNISFEADEFEYSGNIVNGSTCDDMQELIVASDIVITDYSGVMMQAAIARKIVFLLIPDKESYLLERGLCLDIIEMPFPSAMNVQELCACIEEYDDTKYRDRLEEYLKLFEFYDDGNASGRVSEKILLSIG